MYIYEIETILVYMGGLFYACSHVQMKAYGLY